MKRFLSFIQALCFLATLCAAYAQACEIDKNSSLYPPLAVDGGFVVFGPVAVPEDEGKPNPEMGIGVSFLDCSTGIKKFISRLPYVADPGEVQDAFLAETGNSRKALFIIHSAPIRAFTGVSYGSEYFSVLAFSQNGKEFSIDKKLTDYFGNGADVVIHTKDIDTPLYIYPYKTRSAIVNKLKTEEYRHWLDDSLPELMVARKTIIYASMTIADPTKMYLVKGDRVIQESISAGWISILYKTAKGKDIRGWVLCGDVGGC